MFFSIFIVLYLHRFFLRNETQIKLFYQSSPFVGFDVKMKLVNKRVSKKERREKRASKRVENDWIEIPQWPKFEKFFLFFPTEFKATTNNCFDIVIWKTNCCANLIKCKVFNFDFTQSSLELETILIVHCIVSVNLR